MPASVSTLALLGGAPAIAESPRNHWPRITEADIAACVDLLRSGELSTTGRTGEILALERRYEAYFGRAHAIATSSGTAALHSAYFGVGLEPGDEVLAPTYTYLATVMPLFVCNTVPVLVDAEPDTGNLNPAALERHIGPRTRAVVVTHNAGVPVDMPAVLAVAERHGLRVIEDCSQAHGAICAGRKVGTFADVAVFSMQNKKLVPAGEGGMLITDDPEIHERSTLLGHPRDRGLAEVRSERYRRYAETGFGLKYRIHPIAAALAGRQFDRLEAHVHDRVESLERLSAALTGVPGIRPPVLGAHVERAVYYSYRPLYVEDELDGLPIEVFVAALRAEGVAIDRPRAGPLHLEAMFREPSEDLRTYSPGTNHWRRYASGQFPGSERYHARVLRLPSYDHLSSEDAARIREALVKVTRALGALHDHARATGRSAREAEHG